MDEGYYSLWLLLYWAVFRSEQVLLCFDALLLTFPGHLDWATNENLDNVTGKVVAPLETHRESTVGAPASDRVGRDPWFEGSQNSQRSYGLRRASSFHQHSTYRTCPSAVSQTCWYSK